MKKLIALAACVFAFSAIANDNANHTATENAPAVAKKAKKPTAKAKKADATTTAHTADETAQPAGEHQDGAANHDAAAPAEAKKEEHKKTH